MAVSNVTPDIRYIGVDDKELDLFESQYPTPHGISYNSYLIMDEKVALTDTVDGRMEKEWVKNLHEALGGRKPDYLIVQHMEPDHAGSLLALLRHFPDVRIVASTRAVMMMPQFFEDTDFEGRTITVKDGDTLCLGRHTLEFVMAPMVHWPEVMTFYDRADKVMFSADAFGKFGTLAHKDGWTDEARRYYINICGRYGAQVQSLLKRIARLDVRRICPLHGPVLEGDLTRYIRLYDTWSSYRAETEGVLIAHASIYGGTSEAAHTLADILRKKGVKVILADLTREDMSLAVSDAFRMSRMVVAASSYDGNIFPPMHTFLHHLHIKGYQQRRVGIIENGSWMPCAGKQMRTMLEKMKEIDIAEPMLTIRSRMKRADVETLEALAEALLTPSTNIP